MYNLLTTLSDNQFLPKERKLLLEKYLYFSGTPFSVTNYIFDTLNVLVLSLLSSNRARTMRPPDHMWPGTRA